MTALVLEQSAALVLLGQTLSFKTPSSFAPAPASPSSLLSSSRRGLVVQLSAKQPFEERQQGRLCAARGAVEDVEVFDGMVHRPECRT